MQSQQEKDWVEHQGFDINLFPHVFNLRFLLVLALALLFLTVFWQAPQELEGEIYDGDTQLILPDTKVILNDFQGNVLDSAMTDDAGRFIFAVKQRQVYSLFISRPGYSTRMVSDSENMNASLRAVVLRIGVRRLNPDPGH